MDVYGSFVMQFYEGPTKIPDKVCRNLLKGALSNDSFDDHTQRAKWGIIFETLADADGWSVECGLSGRACRAFLIDMMERNVIARASNGDLDDCDIEEIACRIEEVVIELKLRNL